MNTRRDLTPPNFLAVLECRNKLGKGECYNCGEQVEHQGCCYRCDEPWRGDGGNGFISQSAFKFGCIINWMGMDDGERTCAVVGVRDAAGVRVSVQPSDRDATEWCEKTAMEIYATSALPYPFPVDSEIYDH